MGSGRARRAARGAWSQRTVLRTRNGDDAGDELVEGYVRVAQPVVVDRVLRDDEAPQGFDDVPHVEVHGRRHPVVLDPEGDELPVRPVASEDHTVPVRS